MFVNTEPAKTKLSNSRAPKSLYLPGNKLSRTETQAMSLDRDGAEALVKEAAERSPHQSGF